MAISMDNAQDAAQMSGVIGHTFPVLPDPQGIITNSYGAFNLLGDGLAAPATFVVDADGIIQWNHVGSNINDRPSAGEVLEVVRGG